MRHKATTFELDSAQWYTGSLSLRDLEGLDLYAFHHLLPIYPCILLAGSQFISSFSDPTNEYENRMVLGVFDTKYRRNPRENPPAYSMHVISRQSCVVQCTSSKQRASPSPPHRHTSPPHVVHTSGLHPWSDSGSRPRKLSRLLGLRVLGKALRHHNRLLPQERTKGRVLVSVGMLKK